MSISVAQPVVTVPDLATFNSSPVRGYVQGGAQLAYLQGQVTELDGGEGLYQAKDNDFSTAVSFPSIIADSTGQRWYLTGGTVPGVLTVPHGGTGVGSVTANSLLVGNGTSALQELAPGAGVAAWLATPSSANLRTAVTDETGTGSLVFATSPTLVTPILGTPTSGTLTNCTGFPAASLAGLGANVAAFLATPSSANLAAALTDETGSGAAVFANSPTLVTPTLGAASATSLSFSSTSGIIGTTTNNNAAAGSVGEYVESAIAAGSAVSLTSTTAADLTSISLTAGDWDVWLTTHYIFAATTVCTQLIQSISQTSATNDVAPGSYITQFYAAGTTPTAANIPGFNVGPVRKSLASTTTIYAVATATFTVDTCTVYGVLRARRVR